MTMGELALLIDAEEHLGLALDIVPLRGWRRDETYDETGLPVGEPVAEPSDVDEELLYPGVGLLEGYEPVGGTRNEHPIRGGSARRSSTRARSSRALAREHVPGSRFEATRFTPTRASTKERSRRR